MAGSLFHQHFDDPLLERKIFHFIDARLKLAALFDDTSLWLYVALMINF